MGQELWLLGIATLVAAVVTAKGRTECRTGNCKYRMRRKTGQRGGSRIGHDVLRPLWMSVAEVIGNRQRRRIDRAMIAWNVKGRNARWCAGPLARLDVGFVAVDCGVFT